MSKNYGAVRGIYSLAETKYYSAFERMGFSFSKFKPTSFRNLIQESASRIVDNFWSDSRDDMKVASFLRSISRGKMRFKDFTDYFNEKIASKVKVKVTKAYEVTNDSFDDLELALVYSYKLGGIFWNISNK